MGAVRHELGRYLECRGLRPFVEDRGEPGLDAGGFLAAVHLGEGLGALVFDEGGEGVPGTAEQPPLPQTRGATQDVVGPGEPVEERLDSLLGDCWEADRCDEHGCLSFI
ncbi:hypothetical protein JOE61_003425 [Nocardioides salarius]|uniref:Uncharacterized protein n=1 Tax=Nocardioides salarius TaxID=374513 RepID=A0ABS2MEK0_9ACTN|nr:hypothetical protein [Nocardioides salarius]MBM7509611.1 hypothetical protein [Nocardioides salarius]